jgi:hypothetical protein
VNAPALPATRDESASWAVNAADLASTAHTHAPVIQVTLPELLVWYNLYRYQMLDNTQDIKVYFYSSYCLLSIPKNRTYCF